MAAVRDEAMWRTKAGLAKVLLYKQEHGAYPSTLDEAGVTDTDPFTGKPLLYVRKPDEVRVYSVGLDGVDNHGMRSSERPTGSHHTDQYDEVASFPPMKLKARRTTR